MFTITNTISHNITIFKSVVENNEYIILMRINSISCHIKSKNCILDGNQNSLKIKWVSIPQVDLAERQEYLSRLENKLGYPLEYNCKR